MKWFRVRIWEEMHEDTPLVDAKVTAMTFADAVVTVCKQERIARADWVRVTIEGTTASMAFLDITLSPRGWFRYEASY